MEFNNEPNVTTALNTKATVASKVQDLTVIINHRSFIHNKPTYCKI